MNHLLPSFQSVHRQERLDRIFKSPSELAFQRWIQPSVVVKQAVGLRQRYLTGGQVDTLPEDPHSSVGRIDPPSVVNESLYHPH